MTTEMLLGLVGFAFVMSISPGPANFVLLASGVTFGFRKSIPLVLGVSAGFLSMVFAVGVGLGPILRTWPTADLVLKAACSAYVIWLAVKIARSSPTATSAEPADRPITFVQSALFQLVNPKAWAVALIVTVSYTSTTNYVASLLAMILVFAVVNVPSISMWALFGVGLRGVMQDPAKVRVVNIAMALLLVASMVPVLLGGSILS
jgi:threonine/homoserine/homoserine lactone efflux protein